MRRLLQVLDRIAAALERGNLEITELRRTVRDTGRQISSAIEEAAVRLSAVDTPSEEGGDRD